MILYMLITACCNRCRKKNKAEVASDEADGVKTLLISEPTNTTTTLTRNSKTHQKQPVHYETVLVTRQNGVALHETRISSDSTLLPRKDGKKRTQGHAEVISTIKRTHSVDEGTQTDIEEARQKEGNVERPSRTISIQEAQELGDLVEGLNYYNSRIDDDDAFYPQFSGHHFQSKPNQQKIPPINNQERYYYANRGPSYDEEGRSSSNTPSATDRLPLLMNSNVATQPSPYHNRHHSNRLYDNKRSLSRNPSEISYATSASSNISDTSLGNYSTDANYQVDNLRKNSIQRTTKPGVRGDGYEFIVNSSSRSNSSR